MHEFVGVNVDKVAIIEARFLIEMQGVKAAGDKVLHIEAADQLQNIAPELRGHRSETELQSPEMLKIRDAYLMNYKKGLRQLRWQGRRILECWGWA
jgi:hypothetical protein